MEKATDPMRGSRDLAPEAFVQAGQHVLDWIAAYLAHPERHSVLPRTQPGELRRILPTAPPHEPEPLDAILKDVEGLIAPRLTHWNHPGFMAYFGISASAPAILGELYAAAFNVNAMLWKSAPAATELEEVALDWLRQLMGLPQRLFGVIQDTASSSTLVALAAARQAIPGLDVRRRGLTGGVRLRLYASEQAHSSVEKAAIVLGIGQDGLRKIGVDTAFRMDPAALAAAVAEDRAAGFTPFAVVGTVGTTSTTSVDPIPALADLCAREGLWLHVDAAYGGSAAVVPEMRWVLQGCERADSLVVNPHKWLFVPIDLSALYTRRPDVLRAAFSLVPEYLQTPGVPEALNLMDYGVSLGRRFRALKLWLVIRAFGHTGLAARLREHLRLAQLVRGWIEAEERFEVVAPTPFSVVCFRALYPGLSGAEQDRRNEALLDLVNASGEVFLSHTRLLDRTVLRLAIGNLRTEERHVRRAWELLKEGVARL